MKCKQCKKECEKLFVRYEKVQERIIEEMNFHPVHIKDEPVDVGIFCSNSCLLNYVGGNEDAIKLLIDMKKNLNESTVQLYQISITDFIRSIL